MSNEILVQQDGAILRVTLNRPDDGNAVSDATAGELTAILDRMAPGCGSDQGKSSIR